MSFDQSWLTIGGMTMLVIVAVQFTKKAFDPRQIAAGCFRRPGQVARALNSASRSPSSTPSSRATRCSRAASRASSRSNL